MLVPVAASRPARATLAMWERPWQQLLLYCWRAVRTERDGGVLGTALHLLHQSYPCQRVAEAGRWHTPVA